MMTDQDIKSRISNLESALSDMIGLVVEYHKDIGGCDHDVGICLCGERAVVETAISVLENRPPLNICDDIVHDDNRDPWKDFTPPSGTTKEIMDGADDIKSQVAKGMAIFGCTNEPAMRWIKCSERLPEKNRPQEPLIVIVKNNKSDEYMNYLADFDGGRFFSLSGKDISMSVVAWLCGVPEYHP